MYFIKKNLIHLVIVIGLLCSISGLHFFISVYKGFYHDIFDRLYYLPIIISAFFFGLKGGSVVAVISAILLSIHLSMQWAMFYPSEIFGRYLENVMYIIVGVITGILSDLEKKRRNQKEKAYEKLSASFEKAKEAARLAAIGKISAGVAHEIKNPLGALKGAIEVISPDYKPDNPKYRFVKIIENEIDRLNKIVKDFLNFSIPPKPDLAPANLNHLLQAVIDLNKKNMDAKKISITYEFDNNVKKLLMDSNQIKQVFLNVILNSIDAMPDGGKLDVVSHISEKGLEVIIIDTGKGIDQNILDQLFEPFFTTNLQGTGMGLAISKQIIEKHGGSISIKNRNDSKKGARVAIKLPLTEQNDRY